jgi:hypothetical protein
MGWIEEHDDVQALGSKIGYGRIMQLCTPLWHSALRASGFPTGGELTVGPAQSAMVPCLCRAKSFFKENCDWCAGTRQLTKRVFAAMEVELKPQSSRA